RRLGYYKREPRGGRIETVPGSPDASLDRRECLRGRRRDPHGARRHHRHELVRGASAARILRLSRGLPVARPHPPRRLVRLGSGTGLRSARLRRPLLGATLLAPDRVGGAALRSGTGAGAPRRGEPLGALGIASQRGPPRIPARRSPRALWLVVEAVAA